jgi:phospholipid/cholesterol/gamma-HCH transport system substrate-binding protein
MRRAEYHLSQVRVGLFIAICGILMFAGVFYFGVSGKSFAKRGRVRSAFDSVFGLATGSPVEMGGVVIGQIEHLDLPDIRTGLVPVTLAVEPRALERLGASSVAFTSSHALVGQRFVGLTVRKENEPPLPNNGFVRSVPPESLETRATQTLERVDDLIADTRVLLASLNRIAGEVQAGHGTIGHILRDDTLYSELLGAASNAQTATRDLVRGRGALSALLVDPKLGSQVRESVDTLAQTAAQVRAGKGVLGKLTNDDVQARRVEDVLANLDTVSQNLAAGRGTLGALISNPELMHHLDDLLGQVDSLVADVRRNPQRYIKLQAF